MKKFYYVVRSVETCCLHGEVYAENEKDALAIVRELRHVKNYLLNEDNSISVSENVNCFHNDTQ